MFVAGGGSVRIPKLIGVARMTDMLLACGIFNAVDGERIGLARYFRLISQDFDKGMALANDALMHALPDIAGQPTDQRLFTEALIASPA